MGFKVQVAIKLKTRIPLVVPNLELKFLLDTRKNVKNISLIVKSSAIKNIIVKLKNARAKKYQFIQELNISWCGFFKKNIIITGSHGKTTTTSLISKILSDQKLDPTIINGGVINSFNTNAKLGKGDWAILEADESDGSFLKLPINYSVVTNIDYEHIDYYKNFKNLENSFIKFLEKTPPTGKAII